MTLEAAMAVKMGEVRMWPSTLDQMRAFVRLVYDNTQTSEVPAHLMAAAAVSMISQIETDIAFHPGTEQAIREWKARTDQEG